VDAINKDIEPMKLREGYYTSKDKTEKIISRYIDTEQII